MFSSKLTFDPRNELTPSGMNQMDKDRGNAPAAPLPIPVPVKNFKGIDCNKDPEKCNKNSTDNYRNDLINSMCKDVNGRKAKYEAVMDLMRNFGRKDASISNKVVTEKDIKDKIAELTHDTGEAIDYATYLLCQQADAAIFPPLPLPTEKTSGFIETAKRLFENAQVGITTVLFYILGLALIIIYLRYVGIKSSQVGNLREFFIILGSVGLAYVAFLYFYILPHCAPGSNDYYNPNYVNPTGNPYTPYFVIFIVGIILATLMIIIPLIFNRFQILAIPGLFLGMILIIWGNLILWTIWPQLFVALIIVQRVILWGLGLAYTPQRSGTIGDITYDWSLLFTKLWAEFAYNRLGTRVAGSTEDFALPNRRLFDPTQI